MTPAMHRALMIVLLLIGLVATHAPQMAQAAPSTKPNNQAFCYPMPGAPYQSGSSVVAIARINCSASVYNISVQGTLYSPSGATTVSFGNCYYSSGCIATVSAPFAYGTWYLSTGGGYIASSGGFYQSVGTISSNTTFTPPSGQPAPGPQLWLRADAGVTLNSGKVSNWADQSGFGNHAYMPNTNPGRQPTLVTNALNGKPIIRFGGAQSLALTSPVSPNSFTIFIVGKNSMSSESFSMILGPGGSSPNNQMRWENGSSALFDGASNNLPTITSSIGNTRVYHALSVRYNGSTMQVYRDGNLISTHTFTTTGPWTLGQIGAWYSSHFMVGDLAEVLIYSSSLSESDRLSTNNYLKGKYALP
jgi:hypothetical protein